MLYPSQSKIVRRLSSPKPSRQSHKQRPLNPKARKRPALFMDKNGLGIRRKPTIGEYIRFAHTLAGVRSSIQWTIGDFLNLGDETFGEKAAQVWNVFDVTYGVLRNWKWVASVFPMSLRNDNLYWSHHRAVAIDAVPEEDRAALLAMAERDKMSSDALREYVKLVFGGGETWQEVVSFEGDPLEALKYLQSVLGSLPASETVKVSGKIRKGKKAVSDVA